MTKVEDSIENGEEVMEDVEEATLNRKRKKSKYGSDLIEDDNGS